MAKKRPPRDSESPPPISLIFTDDAGDNVDAAVLRSLTLLTEGDLKAVSDVRWPPKHVLQWLQRADLLRIHGLLILALQRWHELK